MEEDTEDHVKVNSDDTDVVDDADNCVSLEEKVTPETSHQSTAIKCW